MLPRTLDALVENFALLGDWEERYRYLIELGRDLEPMADTLKTPETFVQGCTSQVWMVADQGADGRWHVVADSDAHIVRGLIAVLLTAYQDRTSAEIAAVDIDARFSEIGLDEHLSPNRRNGFFSMVERIKALSST